MVFNIDNRRCAGSLEGGKGYVSGTIQKVDAGGALEIAYSLKVLCLPGFYNACRNPANIMLVFFKHVHSISATDLYDIWQQLAYIHRAPAWLWPALVTQLLVPLALHWADCQSPRRGNRFMHPPGPCPTVHLPHCSRWPFG
jgi:hypothetical protein